MTDGKGLLDGLGLGDLGGVSAELLPVILSLVGIIVKLVRSNGDAVARQEALLDAAEVAKAALDRERFGDG